MNDDDNKFTPEGLLGLREKTKDLLANLTAREARALRARFGIHLSQNHTLEDIGRQFEVTRKRIREIEAKALRKLRKQESTIPDQSCSFCGKSVNDVKRLIASEIKNVSICDECIKICGDLLGN